MKNIAILGIMFLSLGAFAQQNSNIEAKQKEKVCVIQRDQAQQPQMNHRMITAPIQNAPNHAYIRAVRADNRKQAKRGQVRDQKMVVPLKRKSAEVKAKQ